MRPVRLVRRAALTITIQNEARSHGAAELGFEVQS